MTSSEMLLTVVPALMIWHLQKESENIFHYIEKRIFVGSVPAGTINPFPCATLFCWCGIWNQRMQQFGPYSIWYFWLIFWIFMQMVFITNKCSNNLPHVKNVSSLFSYRLWLCLLENVLCKYELWEPRVK